MHACATNAAPCGTLHPPQVGRMLLADRCGTRMPAVRATVAAKIGSVYKGLDTTLECFPADDVQDDPDAYKKVSSTHTSV